MSIHKKNTKIDTKTIKAAYITARELDKQLEQGLLNSMLYLKKTLFEGLIHDIRKK